MTTDGPRFLLFAHRLTPTNELLLEALRGRGRASAVVDSARDVREGDTVLARLDVLPSLDGVENGLWELRGIERAGIRVLNRSAALLTSHDKLATALVLGRNGVPHPRTGCVDEISVRPQLAFPLVVKPRFGSWGRDVHLCRTGGELADRLLRLRRKRWFKRHGALVQELVPPSGYDLRLVVAGGRVVGGVERVAAPGEWRTNIALGGHRRRFGGEPPAAAVELALAAAAAVGGDLVGIDLLPDAQGGYVVLEVNGAVDFTADYGAPGVDVFDTVAEALLEPALAAADTG